MSNLRNASMRKKTCYIKTMYGRTIPTRHTTKTRFCEPNYHCHHCQKPYEISDRCPHEYF